MERQGQETVNPKTIPLSFSLHLQAFETFPWKDYEILEERLGGEKDILYEDSNIRAMSLSCRPGAQIKRPKNVGGN